MHLSFLVPQLLLLLVGLPLLGLMALRLLDTTPGARLALALRIAQVSLLILALARPVIDRPDETVAVVYAIDQSESLGESERSRALSWVNAALAELPAADRAGVVAFGADARVLRPLSSSREPLAGSDLAPPNGQTEATDVAAGLRLAASLFLPNGGKRIVLLTDGQDNAGGAAAEARQLAARGIQVDHVSFGQVPDPEVYLEGIEVASYAREGEPLDIAISVQSSREGSGTLRLWTDGDLTLNQQVQLKAGPNRFATTLTALSKGFHAFRARIDGTADTNERNNEDFASTVVKEPARVAVIARSVVEADPIRGLLAQGGVRADYLSPSAIPPSFGPLKPYDGLVLVNVPAEALTLDQMRTLQGFVESLGRGLFVVGGADAYGVGGYEGTELAELLPVKVRAPSRVDTGEIALLLILDRSGSMDQKTEDGATKIGAARDALMLAANSLSPKDHLGILAFDTEMTWVSPIRQIGDSNVRQQMEAAIRGLDASGGTEIFPALEKGYEALSRVPARFRYIVLLSDGVSFTAGDYTGLTAKMRSAGIVLSTIAIGSDSDQELLKRLAEMGEGRYYYTNRASDIPKLTMRETQLASGAPTIEGDVEPRVQSPSPILRSLPTNLPVLRGQAAAAAREGATVALASQRDDPILAHWQRGLGRVAVWMSDGGERWATNWTGRADLAQFWSQAVRWTLPVPLTSGLYIRPEIGSDEVALRVEAVDDAGSLQNLLDLHAQVGDGQDGRDGVQLAQVAPGRYESRIARPPAGVYPIEVVEYRDGKPTDHRETVGIVVGYPAEYRRFGPDNGLLGQLSEPSRGAELSEVERAYRPEGLRPAGQERLPVWPWLVGLALVLFPFDVAIRRLRTDHTLARRLLERLSALRPRLRIGRR